MLPLPFVLMCGLLITLVGCARPVDAPRLPAESVRTSLPDREPVLPYEEP